jgi:hypothetical protein
MPYGDEALLKIIRDLQNGLGSDDQVNDWIVILSQSLPHPNVSDLIFFHTPELSAEQILSIAKSYKPIVPPPPMAE